MSKYLKIFLLRGLIFGGFGSITVGVIYYIISLMHNISYSGSEVLMAILSGYFIAFIHAGASVFNHIEEWSPAKALLLHLSTLYITYSFFYIINSWIAFNPTVLLIFTLIFVVSYFIIWLIVYLSIKAAAKRLDRSIKK